MAVAAAAVLPPSAVLSLALALALILGDAALWPAATPVAEACKKP